jgi:hypothetical protein
VRSLPLLSIGIRANGLFEVTSGVSGDHLKYKMLTIKLNIEKFDRNTNFSLWHVKIKAILIQNGVHKALEGDERKPIGLSEAKWEEMDAKAFSAIQFSLSNEVLREVVEEVTSKGI